MGVLTGRNVRRVVPSQVTSAYPSLDKCCLLLLLLLLLLSMVLVVVVVVVVFWFLWE